MLTNFCNMLFICFTLFSLLNLFFVFYLGSQVAVSYRPCVVTCLWTQPIGFVQSTWQLTKIASNEGTTTQLCYNCNSCKAGLLAELKKEWSRANAILIIILIALIIVYLVGFFAFRHAMTELLTDFILNCCGQLKLRKQVKIGMWIKIRSI